ncbi:GNAT family N-acetyltransferase [Achromobacter sp. NPDC058515]|uniref:GNAT family N-acetyltransferase n=1 Tax=Achromobacter sp. NPDC058515 TaxID=3346533 RepID=UPI003668D1AE
MQLRVEVTDALERIAPGDYEAFYAESQASLFYDPRFLLAAERSPLLPALGSYYLCVFQERRLVAFLPVYLQQISTVDPLGVLRRTAGLVDDGGDLGLFSHIMHCFESTIPSVLACADVYRLLFEALAELAARTGARYYGILNVRDAALLASAKDCGLHINYMVDSFHLDAGDFRDFDDLVAQLPSEGRWEMNRQLRKFAASGTQAHVVTPPFGGKLEQLAGMCHTTTARHGTPQYFPKEELVQFCELCGDLVRLCVIERDGRLISGLICFEKAGVFYIWSAGMDYDQTDFSPYTISFATCYRHALERQCRRVEGGRLNFRIKTRLGLHPRQLFAITSADLADTASLDSSTGAAAIVRASPSTCFSGRKE